MNTMIVGLLAETSIHPGAGQSAGFVDLPVAREAATDYPVIVGSSVKGALLDMAYWQEFTKAKASGQSNQEAKKTAKEEVETIFGRQDNAGVLLVSDMRLVLLPVRSLKSQYKWITCPHLVERLVRDKRRQMPSDHAETIESFDFAKLSEGGYLGVNEGDLFLEERQFRHADGLPEQPQKLVDLIDRLIRHDETRRRLPGQLVVLSDKDFTWFARFGLAVNARNQLDQTRKTSNNLWYEETIAPDSVFYCLLAERGAGALDTVRAMFEKRPYIQVGGNETVGHGWFAVALPEGQGGAQ